MSAGARSGARSGALEIRPLAGRAEREACVALQERVWGEAFADRVPASVLMIALETGGVASGAFLDDRLVGFVFGITGVRDGRPIHWSDMLAVAPEHRGEGIGYRLKLHQRALLLDRGVETVRWTFEPLEARNAHINLRRLGAVAREYRRDAYGSSDSPLHAGIGTDRLVAEWPIASARVRGRVSEPEGTADDSPADAAGPILNPPAAGGPPCRPGATVVEAEGLQIRIAVPSNIQWLKAADPALALAWRENVRSAFERAFEGGYTAVDLQRPVGDDPVGDDPAGDDPGAGIEAGTVGVAFYVLARGFSL